MRRTDGVILYHTFCDKLCENYQCLFHLIKFFLSAADSIAKIRRDCAKLSDLRQDVRDVRLVERREGEALLAEVVERRAMRTNFFICSNASYICLLFKVTICGLSGELALLDVAICDLQSSSSSLVNWNMKLSGKRLILRFTCSFNLRGGTPYRSAKSRSSMTCTPRIVRIRERIESASACPFIVKSFMFLVRLL